MLFFSTWSSCVDGAQGNSSTIFLWSPDCLQLDIQLDDRDKQLLEKTLMLQEVERMVVEAQKAADATGQETLAEAKRVSCSTQTLL